MLSFELSFVTRLETLRCDDDDDDKDKGPLRLSVPLTFLILSPVVALLLLCIAFEKLLLSAVLGSDRSLVFKMWFGCDNFMASDEVETIGAVLLELQLLMLRCMSVVIILL
jgi:uncharacterized membrane protein